MAFNYVHVSALADPDLAQVFRHLPPFDRLRVSEVCKRWSAVSQDPWRDVTCLELISIPSQSIGAIVRKCPNLTHLFCQNQRLILDDLRVITLASFKALQLHSCTFVSHNNSVNRTTLPLFRSDEGQSMDELVLHKPRLGVEVLLSERYSRRLLPASLKRLQLSEVNREEDRCAQDCYLAELRKQRNLECLILGISNVTSFNLDSLESEGYGVQWSLRNLRELLLSPSRSVHNGEFYWSCAYQLLCIANVHPKLEILFFPYYMKVVPANLGPLLKLFAKHPTLRILVLQGAIIPPDDVQVLHVPARDRFRRGVGTRPLPFLHVFVGEQAADFFRFDDSPTNGLKVHRIDAPFPEMLEREKIGEIFGDSWIAKQIREGAKHGATHWRYEEDLVEAV